jgi:di/tricarboxylate transporter
LVLTVALLSTVFSLLMSNVGAVMVLAPLVMNMGVIGGVDPRPLALLAAVCVANSFLLPTHQVNAFLMSPGGYTNADYIKAGGGMTLVFIVVAVTAFLVLFI